MPAVGFGTVAGEGLARHVADQVPEARRLDLAVLAGTDGSTAGARAFGAELCFQAGGELLAAA